MIKLIFKEEAIQRITELLINLANEENQVDSDGGIIPSTLAVELTARRATLNFYVTKLVEDILAYCHRRDFPAPLIYTVVELLMKRFKDEISTISAGVDAPMSKVKMGDTEYSFDTSFIDKVDLTKIVSEELFNTLKSKLNLYRKVVSR